MDPLREIGLTFLLAEAAIWLSRDFPFLSYGFGLSAFLFILRYWFRNRHSVRNLFHPAGTGGDYLFLGFILFLCWLSIIHLGELATPNIIENPKAYARCWNSFMPGYLANAFWQQLLVLGYFVPRAQERVRAPWKITLGIGTLFALVHIPNPVLVPVTFIGGTLCVYFFQRTRNLYVLVAAHALLAVTVMHFLPSAWHHHMTIGPRYFSWKP